MSFRHMSRTPDSAVYWFLKSRAPIAFSPEEIMFELGALSIILDLDTIGRSLTLLEERARVESAPANATVYYRYVNHLGFRPPRT